MIVRHAARTDVGNWREKNEDSFLVKEDLGLFAVADGMGGHVGGGLASQLCLKGLEESMRRLVRERTAEDPESTQRQPLFQRLSRAFKGPPQPRDAREVILRKSMEDANQTVYQYARANPKYKGMGTTLTSLWIDPADDTSLYTYIANLGDSRTYLVREGELHLVTQDHSWVQEQVREGRLSSVEAEAHYLKNVVTRCVGLDEHVDVDVFQNELREKDRYLLCSDGLTNMLRPEEMNEALAGENLDAVADDLVERAKIAGGMDNITVVLVELTRL